MIYRNMTIDDIDKFGDDIHSVYEQNKLIFDCQCPIHLDTVGFAQSFVAGFINSDDSIVIGIFDSSEEYLYGIVIFDKLRISTTSCAQVHIATDKVLWGKQIREIYNNILNDNFINVIYCEIPSIAVNAIKIAKELGFKKTGYIPKSLPYVNSRGVEKMYDTIILTREV